MGFYVHFLEFFYWMGFFCDKKNKEGFLIVRNFENKISLKWTIPLWRPADILGVVKSHDVFFNDTQTRIFYNLLGFFYKK
jgi:hypothetical protein